MKKKKKLDEGAILLAPLLPVGGVHGLGGMRTKEDNFEFKGLPGQFDKDGNKILDENGNKIEIQEVNLAGKTKLSVNTKIKIIKSSDKEDVGIEGELTHPFGFGSGIAGLYISKPKGIYTDNKMNLIGNETIKIIDSGKTGILKSLKESTIVNEVEDAKYYINLLADVEDGLNELVKIGEDFSVFQNAKHAAKSLKQAYKLVNKVK